MNDELCIFVKSRTYMTVKSMSEYYESTPQTIRRNIKAMKESGRYDRTFISLDDDGKPLYNSLMYEDYLAHKVELKNKNLARRLSPYDPAEVRRQRGEYRSFLSN